MQIMERKPRESAREYALRVIRANITSLDLEPGSMVTEKELAEEMGLSRTPVREALMDLAKTKIVEIYPQCGSRISLIDYNLVEESRFLRLVVEKAIVELACNAEVPLDFSRIEENLRLQQFYLEKGTRAKLLELDDEFHKELFRICNRMLTYDLTERMSVHFDRVRTMGLMTIKDVKVVTDHAALLKAIQERQNDEAQRILVKHLSRYKVEEEMIRPKYPNYFK